MNLADPELELIDPTPNVHSLFIQFDKIFFSTRLASRAVVRWSKRMYSCAGVCSYEGRGGLCDIALSEPLLKLRPRKDLIETLLHEMIHAYLFVTCRDQDRDGHGPNFKAHMHRINQSAGLNISIYHDFHDEVRLYQTHVWRCNGPCQKVRPYFGIVRRSANRAPGPNDFWWSQHQRQCGGTFVKIQQPDKPTKQTKASSKNTKAKDKPNADITKYISTQKTGDNKPTIVAKPVLKDSNIITFTTKNNGCGNTLVITKKEPAFKPQSIFSGKGETLSGARPRSNSVGVVEAVRNVWANKNLPTSPTLTNSSKQNSPKETVRNVWANKQLPPSPIAPINKNKTLNKTLSVDNHIPNKHKIDSHSDSPPAKMKKINDYFKTASNVLKDLYGHDFQVTNENKKLVANVVTKTDSKITEKSPVLRISNNDQFESSSQNLVGCPVCSALLRSQDINRHLDECLNRDVIEKLSKEEVMQVPHNTNSKNDGKILKEPVRDIPKLPYIKPESRRSEVFDNIINEINERQRSDSLPTSTTLNSNDKLNTASNLIIDTSEDPFPFIRRISGNTKTINKTKVPDTFEKEMNNNIDKGNEVPKKEEIDNLDLDFLPFLDEANEPHERPLIKKEPGTSDSFSNNSNQKCACCGKQLDKPIEDHLEECLAFFGNNATIPNEGASTSSASETIVIDDDDDDIFDDSQIFNATGTKSPCPCCLQMVEDREMNDHLDICLAN